VGLGYAFGDGNPEWRSYAFEVGREEKKPYATVRSVEEEVAALEAYLHQLGYKYTGPGNLYQVTFFEIANLSKGKRIMALMADGVSPMEEAALNKLAEQLED